MPLPLDLKNILRIVLKHILHHLHKIQMHAVCEQCESFQWEYSSINQVKPAFRSRIRFKLEPQINISEAAAGHGAISNGDEGAIALIVSDILSVRL